MKAAVIRIVEGKKRIAVEDVPIPEISEHQALIRVGAVGICGSDFHGFRDQQSFRRSPGLIMGHEAAGEVVKLGAKVCKVKIGDRVAMDPQFTCGVCEPCSRGWHNICDKKRIIGSSSTGILHGAMAEYLAVHENQLHTIPDSLSMVEGAAIEPVANALHVLNRVKFNLGDSIVIIGAGTLGLCIVQAAKLAGAGQVIITNTSGHRLQVARELGADITIQVSPHSDPVEEVLKATNGRGADVVIEAVGIEQTYRHAISMARKKGAVLFFGAVTETIGIDLYPILHKELNLLGCTGADREWSTAIDLLASGKINVKPIITHQLLLKNAQEGFELLTDSTNRAIKVMLVPE